MSRPVPELASALPGLRSLTLFGSCLSTVTARPGSIPDWFAVVDDVGAALQALGVGPLGRRVARWLPPVTVAPKVTLIEPDVLANELLERHDLYLAGRLGKRTERVWVRDPTCAAELEAAQQTARASLVELTLWGLPRRVPFDEVVRRCVGLSYRAEVRPERAEKIAAVHDAFAPWYRETYGALLATRRDGDDVVDDRADDVRAREAKALRALLWRSRLRSMLRWPKEMMVYRGWFPYLLGKLHRAWLAPAR